MNIDPNKLFVQIPALKLLTVASSSRQFSTGPRRGADSKDVKVDAVALDEQEDVPKVDGPKLRPIVDVQTSIKYLNSKGTVKPCRRRSIFLNEA